MNRIAAVAFASVLASTAQADQNSAFQDAKSFAGGKTQGVFTGISSGAVANKIPGYGANPSETQFFQGGQGALSGPGVTKMQNCASYAPGQNKIANQECEAVNFLARNPEVRPQFNIGSNDPIVISAKEARKNAESFFQTLDINGGAEGSTQCTTKTTTTPAQYTTETCTSLRAVEGQQCTMGRKVDIDADANYQCDKTLTAFTSQERQPTVSTSSCTYGRQVNIDADSNFQCDKTLTAFTSQERLPVVSTSSCTYGRQVNIDEDSRFQCDQSVSSYESLKCKKILNVEVVGTTTLCGNVGSLIGSVEYPNLWYGYQEFMFYCGSVGPSGKRSIDVRFTSTGWSGRAIDSADCDKTTNVVEGVVTPIYDPIPGVNYENLTYPGYGGEVRWGMNVVSSATGYIKTCRRYTGGAYTYFNPIVEYSCTGNTCAIYTMIGRQSSGAYSNDPIFMLQNTVNTFATTVVTLPASNISTPTYTWSNQCAALEARSQ